MKIISVGQIVRMAQLVQKNFKLGGINCVQLVHYPVNLDTNWTVY